MVAVSVAPVLQPGGDESDASAGKTLAVGRWCSGRETSTVAMAECACCATAGSMDEPTSGSPQAEQSASTVAAGATQSDTQPCRKKLPVVVFVVSYKQMQAHSFGGFAVLVVIAYAGALCLCSVVGWNGGQWKDERDAAYLRILALATITPCQ